MTSTPYASSNTSITPGLVSIPIPQVLAGMAAAADVVTDFVVPFDFQVVGLDFLLTTVVSTGAKAATVTLGIGATGSNVAVPGCALALTSANQTPAGKTTSAPATLPAGLNATTYPAGTKICLKSTSVTAFSEGAGVFFIKLRNMDES